MCHKTAIIGECGLGWPFWTDLHTDSKYSNLGWIGEFGLISSLNCQPLFEDFIHKVFVQETIEEKHITQLSLIMRVGGMHMYPMYLISD